MIEEHSNLSLYDKAFSHLLKQSQPIIVILSIAYTIIFLLSVFGNTAVILVVLRIPGMRAFVPNLFICNLSVADLLTAFLVLPVTLLQNLFTEWQLGHILCYLSPYLQGVTICTSTSTLAVIALDRYIAICHPLKRVIYRREALIIIAIIWLVSAVLLIPWFLFYDLETEIDYNTGLNKTQCVQIWPDGTQGFTYFLTVIFLMYYCLPLLLISYFYGAIAFFMWKRSNQTTPYHNGQNCNRSSEVSVPENKFKTPRTFREIFKQRNAVHANRRSQPDGYESTSFITSDKTFIKKKSNSDPKESTSRTHGGLTREKSLRLIKMLIIVVVLFALSWLPLYVLFISFQLNALWVTSLTTDTILPLCQILSSTNCAVNPYIYCLYSRSYREGYKAIARCQSTSTMRRRRTLQMNPPHKQHRHGNLPRSPPSNVIASLPASPTHTDHNKMSISLDREVTVD